MELGTTLAVVAFADQCLKYGSKFVRRCKSYLNAEEEAQELLDTIEINWIKMETQIEILKKVAPSLNKALQDSQSRILSQLEGKLKTASLTIEQLQRTKADRVKKKAHQWRREDHDIEKVIQGLKNMGTFGKAKYVLEKPKLYEIVDDIEKWQARFDPSWIFIMQLSNNEIDKELHEQRKKYEQFPIVKAARGIRDAMRTNQSENCVDKSAVWIQQLDIQPSAINRSAIEFSTIQSKDETVLIDTMVCNSGADATETARGVRDLARVLAEVDPTTFSILSCRGVIKIASKSTPQRSTPACFKFIFNIPRKLSRPRSLRTLLNTDTVPSIDERLDLAKRLANSVLFVHTLHFVHKNIRPETVIVFQNDHSPWGIPFLVGFEQTRLEDGKTFRSGDELWQHNLYRHPTRQGTHPEVDYQMQHDIYSLGVVLLEIGLWTSFVLYDPEEANFPPVPNKILEQPSLAKPRTSFSSATNNKSKLEELAAKDLPARLGNRYSKIVLRCLQCLDKPIQPDASGTAPAPIPLDWTDEDGVEIGVKYIENVLEEIQQIVI